MPLSPSTRAACLLVAIALSHSQPASAQAPASPPRNDARFDPLQPDFTITTLPTTLRMPAHKMYFRLTHRFARPLADGDFGDLISNLFGFDSGAQIGLEFRYGLLSGTQIGINRTSDKTIEVFGEQNLMSERDGSALGLDAFATLEGQDNLTEHFQSALGVVMSKAAGTRVSLYAEPIWVVNSNPDVPEPGSDNSTLLLGLGARARVHRGTYLVAEFIPRLAGYDPGVHQVSFGVEGRAGGHVFQLNFSNSLATTRGQMARGGYSNSDWYIGFNMTRKFF